MMRRSLLALFFALFLAPGPALAQGMGVIYYRSGTTFYQVNGDGTGQSLVATTPTTIQRPTASSSYPGGRIFFWNQTVGTIPGQTSGTTYGNIMVWNQSGTTKQLTAFNGPLYTPTYYTRNLWSNDGQDFFFSFFVYDNATSHWHVYRANVTAAQVADPSFQPLAPGDARLEVVTDWVHSSDEYAWHPSGTKLYYLDQRVTGQWKVRRKVVGVGLTEDDDLVLFSQGITGIRPQPALVASPTSEQLVFNGYNPTTGATGLISLDPTTGAWTWIIQEVAAGKPGLSIIGNPKFSPDGTGITFGAKRFVSSKKGGTYVYGLYKMPANGGPTILLTESPSDGVFKAPYGWTW
jgi:hypothetical protein